MRRHHNSSSPSSLLQFFESSLCKHKEWQTLYQSVGKSCSSPKATWSGNIWPSLEGIMGSYFGWGNVCCVTATSAGGRHIADCILWEWLKYYWSEPQRLLGFCCQAGWEISITKQRPKKACIFHKHWDCVGKKDTALASLNRSTDDFELFYLLPLDRFLCGKYTSVFVCLTQFLGVCVQFVSGLFQWRHLLFNLIDLVQIGL